MTDGQAQPPGPEESSGRLGLIGGIGLTEVTVYRQRPAPDGLMSGCPHVHAVTDEAYYVLAGEGWVEFHDLTFGFRRVSLTRGDYLHFPPGVIHRLVSRDDSQLVVLGIMGNAGMAERGEARVYFGPDVDADPAEYARRMQLPKTLGLEGALLRRDLAVAGYQRLLELHQRDPAAYRAELERFVHVHRHAMAGQAQTLREQVRRGPMAWAQATLERIDGLIGPSAGGRQRDLTDVAANPAGSEAALGMCGTLRPMLRLTQVR